MRSIAVLNAKGGCGKTTLATNLAGYYAIHGKNVVLADFDPQGSSTDWLAARPAGRPAITGIAAWEHPLRTGKDTDYLIMDTPAAVRGKALADIVRRAETLVLPLLPSALDIRAANHFLEELTRLRKVINKTVKLATVANRCREDTIAAHSLEEYLGGLRLPDGRKFPFMTMLRASQNYVRAADRGLCVFELAPSTIPIEEEQWAPLLRWLNSARSVPD